MAFTPTSPVTGSAVSGLTSPTMTIISDTAPVPNAKQWYVSTLGGTQDLVVPSLAGQPYTVTVFKPTSIKTPTKDKDGRVMVAANNTYSVVFRKGVLLDALNTYRIMQVTVKFDVPAGSEQLDANSVKSVTSMVCGFMSANSQNFADMFRTGSL